ncbi:hypothetical protein FRC09_014546 [Ceratobasidium sp. 395]|nr:hypothetical protein FRC09_014546 [Ceratobasidium sp. 395]
MSSKPSKRNRPDSFLGRPTNSVVRPRHVPSEPADARPANAQLDPTLQVPAAEPQSTGRSQLSGSRTNTSTPMDSMTPAAGPTRHFLAPNPTGSSTGELPRVQRPFELELDVNSFIDLPASTTIQQPTASSSSTHAHGKATATLKNGLKRLGQATSAIPPLNSVVDILADCVNAISIDGKGRRDFELLAENIAASVKMLERRSDKFDTAEITESILDVLSELRKQAEDIKVKQACVGKRGNNSAEQDIEYILACYRRVDSLFQRLTSDLVLNGVKIGQETQHVASRNLDMTSEVLEVTKDSYLNTRLDRMQPVKQARYDAGAAEVRRNGCTADTRQSVLQNLVDWSNDEDGAKVYWMNGMAGTGKTTIAYSFCETLRSSNQLGASFFCSRLLPHCRDTSRIVPTLAYQLARTSFEFQEEIIKVMSGDPDICATGVSRQFNALIATPLQKLNCLLETPRLVLVIEPLDECYDRTTTQQVLDTLFRYAPDLPVKFFVTCRPEPGLFDKVMAETLQTRSIFHLHDIEQSIVQADIQTYLLDSCPQGLNPILSYSRQF